MKFYFLFLKTQFLIQECASLITKPNFISTLSYAIDNPLHYQKVGIPFSSPKMCYLIRCCKKALILDLISYFH